MLSNSTRIALVFSCLAALSGPAIGQALPRVPEGYSVTILADGLERPLGMTVAPDGRLLVCTWDSGHVYSIDARGSKTLLNHGMELARASQPVVTADGRVFVTAGGTSVSGKIWEIVAGVPVLFHEGQGAYGLEIDGDGILYFTQSPTGSILRSNLAGTATVFASGLQVGLAELVFGPDGYLFAANNDTGVIYRISPEGTVEPHLSNLPRPEMLAFDPDGNLYFTAFTSSKIYRVNTEKQVELFLTAANDTDIRGIAFDASGALFACDDLRGVIYRIEYTSPRRQFFRGDANDDGAMDLSDALAVLNYLFDEGQVACLDAGDADDDGELNITDAIGLLGFLFLGTFPPREPYPDCGIDRSEDSLSCESSRHCP